MGDEAERAYEKALTFLERSARTEAEIRERLTRAGFAEDVTEQTLDRLRDAGLVDDADYAERYLEVLTAKGRGSRRIADEMRRKGLPDDVVKARIEEDVSREGETAAAFAIAERLFEKLGGPEAAVAEAEAGRDSGSAPGMTGSARGMTELQKIWQKVDRKLVSLGYPYGVVGEVMTKLRSSL
ncbi:MAG: recombination regulator RecX [Clostridiales Family XIII bacterium]|jgi:regulatory protein|nr:recombination regulator RecX [Clostridiales Family XIII bacterium]